MLYSLIHARSILINCGIVNMIEKYQAGDFGHCPRVYSENQPMLPIGLSDASLEAMVKLYCSKCMDVYTPKSSSHWLPPLHGSPRVQKQTPGKPVHPQVVRV